MNFLTSEQQRGEKAQGDVNDFWRLIQVGLSSGMVRITTPVELTGSVIVGTWGNSPSSPAYQYPVVMGGGYPNAPFVSIFDTANYYNGLVRDALDSFIKIHFRANRNLLHAVYRTKTRDNQLHYSIVLKDDTDENRSTIYEILENAELDNLSEEYPIYFQFFPKDLQSKIQYVEVINL